MCLYSAIRTRLCDQHTMYTYITVCVFIYVNGEVNGEFESLIATGCMPMINATILLPSLISVLTVIIVIGDSIFTANYSLKTKDEVKRQLEFCKI